MRSDVAIFSLDLALSSPFSLASRENFFPPQVPVCVYEPLSPPSQFFPDVSLFAPRFFAAPAFLRNPGGSFTCNTPNWLACPSLVDLGRELSSEGGFRENDRFNELLFPLCFVSLCRRDLSVAFSFFLAIRHLTALGPSPRAIRRWVIAAIQALFGRVIFLPGMSINRSLRAGLFLSPVKPPRPGPDLSLRICGVNRGPPQTWVF